MSGNSQEAIIARVASGERNVGRGKGVFTRDEHELCDAAFATEDFRPYGSKKGLQAAFNELAASLNSRRTQNPATAHYPPITAQQLRNRRQTSRRTSTTGGEIVDRTELPGEIALAVVWMKRVRLTMSTLHAANADVPRLLTALLDDEEFVSLYVKAFLSEVHNLVTFAHREVSTSNEHDVGKRRMDLASLVYLYIYQARDVGECDILNIVVDAAARTCALAYVNKTSVQQDCSSAAILNVHRLLALDAYDAMGIALQRRDGLSRAAGGADSDEQAPHDDDLQLTVAERTRFAIVLQHRASDIQDPNSFVRRRLKPSAIAACYNLASYAAQSSLHQCRQVDKMVDAIAACSFSANDEEKADKRAWFMRKTTLSEKHGGLFYASPLLFTGLMMFCASLVYLVVQAVDDNYDIDRIEAMRNSAQAKAHLATLCDEFLTAAAEADVATQANIRSAVHRRRAQMLDMLMGNVLRIFQRNNGVSNVVQSTKDRSQSLVDAQVDRKMQLPLRSAIAAGNNKK